MAPDGRLPSAERLRRRADFQRCYRHGRRRSGAHVIVYFDPNDVAHPRVGLTVSRKVGKAVVRQRVKRRLREIYRRWEGRGELPAVDIVLHARPAAAKASFATLAAELRGLLGSLPGRAR